MALVQHRSNTHMVKGIDEIQAVLDDHIVKTMGIRGSPFVEPIEKEVKERDHFEKRVKCPFFQGL